MTNPQDALLLAIAAVLFWLLVLAVLAAALIALFLHLEKREHKRNPSSTRTRERDNERA